MKIVITRHLFAALILAALSVIFLCYSRAEAADIPVGFGPGSVAINDQTNQAVVTNQYSNSISIIDLANHYVIETINVGYRPTAVAIDKGLNRAVVAHGWDNLSIIDLNIHKVLHTMSIGRLPHNVAINESAHAAYVANLDGTVSIINIQTYQVTKTHKLCEGALDIAIDPALNIALVVREMTNKISVIDLNTNQVIRTVAGGKSPYAIDINPETHQAVVADLWGGNITLIDLQTWETKSIKAGIFPVDVRINRLDNTALVVCYLSNRLVQIDLLTGQITGRYPVHWLSASVAVNSFTNMAGVTDTGANVLTLVQLSNPVPLLKSVTPAGAMRSSLPLVIALAGNKFVSLSYGVFGSQPLTTTFADNHNLQATIPAGLLSQAGVYSLSVFSSQPGGGSSNALALTVTNPVPTITTIDPGSAAAGTQGISLSVYGSGFFSDTIITLNGVSYPFTWVSNTNLTLVLTAANLLNAGTIEIKATNPAPGGGQSNTMTFAVVNPIPTISSVTPDNAKAGSPAFTLIVNGSNFVPATAVSFNNTALQVTYVSSSQITVSLTPAQVATAGTYSIRVTNPAPGGGTSNSVAFTVTKAINVQPLPEGSYGKKYEDLVPKDATIESYDAKRFALTTGLVKDSMATALSGVSVTVLGHPEYGSAQTDSTGRFSIPVNGGGAITYVYQKQGFITSHRQVNVPWNGIATAEPMVMIPEDTAATTVSFNGNPSTVITHRSSTTTDVSGSRALTMVFTGDNRAYVKDANGNEVPLTTITTRATEFSTPESMPAKLPPTSAFTYCSELSVDGAKNVRFEKPVTAYVENFLNFKVGEIVPVGSYDRDKGIWMPEPDGVVVRLLDTNGDGIVDAYDNVGDGLPHGTVVGLNDPTIYRPGATYWQAQVTHFSAWDWNWPWGPPADAQYPNPGGPPMANNKVSDDDCNKVGSYIECRSRIVHEDISIPGTDLTLHYASDRVKGYISGIFVPVSGSSVPTSLKNIIVRLELAGLTFEKTLPAAPNQTANFQWDGKDYLGNQAYGTATANVSIGFVYSGVYYSASPQNITSHWGLPGDSPATPPGAVEGIRAREELITWKRDTIHINKPSHSYAKGTIGEGWTLSSQHSISPNEPSLLYKGDGTAIDLSRILMINTIAGKGFNCDIGDGGPAINACATPRKVTVDGAGNIYIPSNYHIRKIDPNGIITTIAGNGNGGYNGDGMPATQASIDTPWGVAFDNAGNIYIAEYNGNRVRKVDTYGIITTIAGTGIDDYYGSGDGGPATLASLDRPSGVAVDNVGNIYIADAGNGRIRKVDSRGIISTVAGTGSWGESGDGGPATKAVLKSVEDVAVDSRGNIYILDFMKVRKIDASGIITTVAGRGNAGYSGDGGLATQADMWTQSGTGLTVDDAGNIYIPDTNNFRLRKVDTFGNISTIAGTGQGGHTGDGGLAIKAQIVPWGVAVDRGGNIYVGEGYYLRKISMPGALLSVTTEGDIIFNDTNETGYIIGSTGRQCKLSCVKLEME